MTYTVKPTTRFRKDLKLCQKRGYNIQAITDVIKMLAKGMALPEKFHDHQLTGNLKNCRECHIAPDWLLVYEISNTELILYLTRTGTHSDLFGK